MAVFSHDDVYCLSLTLLLAAVVVCVLMCFASKNTLCGWTFSFLYEEVNLNYS